MKLWISSISQKIHQHNQIETADDPKLWLFRRFIGTHYSWAPFMNTQGFIIPCPTWGAWDGHKETMIASLFFMFFIQSPCNRRSLMFNMALDTKTFWRKQPMNYYYFLSCMCQWRDSFICERQSEERIILKVQGRLLSIQNTFLKYYFSWSAGSFSYIQNNFFEYQFKIFLARSSHSINRQVNTA